MEFNDNSTEENERPDLSSSVKLCEAHQLRFETRSERCRPPTRPKTWKIQETQSKSSPHCIEIRIPKKVPPPVPVKKRSFRFTRDNMNSIADNIAAQNRRTNVLNSFKKGNVTNIVYNRNFSVSSPVSPPPVAPSGSETQNSDVCLNANIDFPVLPLPGIHPMMIKISNVEKKRISISSFTTEDGDVFNKVSTQHLPSTEEWGGHLDSHAKKATSNQGDRVLKRKSKSIGAPGFDLKLYMSDETNVRPVSIETIYDQSSLEKSANFDTGSGSISSQGINEGNELETKDSEKKDSISTDSVKMESKEQDTAENDSVMIDLEKNDSKDRESLKIDSEMDSKVIESEKNDSKVEDLTDKDSKKNDSVKTDSGILEDSSVENCLVPNDDNVDRDSSEDSTQASESKTGLNLGEFIKNFSSWPCLDLSFPEDDLPTVKSESVMPSSEEDNRLSARRSNNKISHSSSLGSYGKRTSSLDKKYVRRNVRKHSKRLSRILSAKQKNDFEGSADFDSGDVFDDDGNESFSDEDCSEDCFTDNSELDCDDQTMKTRIKKNLRMTTNDFRNYQDKKVYQIAMELLTTEKNYVRKLHLIDQVFHFEIVVKNREHRIFPMEVIPQMFSNIKSIYQFHHDFLLLQLEKRMGEWDVNPKIGDVMKKFAPFLKLYTEYVQNFDNASSTINFWMDKSDRFYRLVHDLEKLPECGQLTLHHHMLEPIQRVPRYLILLKEYQKFLPHDSLDREDTKEALDLITIAVRHSNEAMKTTDKFRKLVDINESLGGTLDLISPMREYIKEGKIKRLSARDGSHIDRYLFLFNDLLLICQSLPLKLGHNLQFRIKCRMDVEDMEVIEDGHNLLTPNTFYVNCKQKSVEFQASTLEEKASWLKELQDAIIAFKKRKLSANETLNYRHDQLGKRAPTWVKDHETSMCMICSLTFNTFKRRHHCRACGIVVCAKCSSGKARLAYLENREKRVCNKCFQILNQLSKNLADLSASVSVESSEQRKGPGILQVKASDPCVICGYLFMCCDKKSWQLFFFSVHENFVLYAFKAHQDVVAMTSLPLPGYKVEADTKLDSERSFKVHHTSQKKVYYFQTDDKSVRDKWIDVLQKAAQLVLPTDYSRDISSASPSSFVGCMTLKSSNSTSTKAVIASL